MNKILVTGAYGLVGSRYVEMFPSSSILNPRSSDLDISDQKSVTSYFIRNKISCVIHFAALTNVSEAEEEAGDTSGKYWKTNVVGTKNIVAAANLVGAYLVHISTDMVFPGTENNPGPYSEDHQLQPNQDELTWYGYTKAVSESVVMESKINSSIVRLIYPVKKNNTDKLDYLHKPLSLYKRNSLYPLFVDQHISITYIDEACNLISELVKQRQNGIFHASSIDLTTPYDLISYAIDRRYTSSTIQKTTIAQFLKNTGVDHKRYPKFGGLSVNLTQKNLSIPLSSWKQIVDSCL